MSFIFVGRNNMISNHRLSYYGKRMKVIENKHFSCGKKRQMTIMTFISKYPLGTYILGVSGHTFVIKDSTIYGISRDFDKLRTRVQYCWEVYDSLDSSNHKIKRKKIVKGDDYSGYKKGDYMYLGRHITKQKNKWISNKMVTFYDSGGVSYDRVEPLVANNLTEMENLIKEQLYLT